jgi:hypothetical protein
MAHRRLQSSRLALLAGLVGAFLLAPVPRVSADAKARVDAALAELRAALSDHKEGLDTLSKDAAALSEAWREVAVSSWAKIAQSARDALAEIDAWSRNQSLPDDDSEIQV